MDKKTLLEKYQMPISHLDFAYVEKCENAREMEKIVNILRSGEEGYYPDLTRCAEEKLKKLKPESRLFRFEEQIAKSDILPKEELKPIYDWTHHIKYKDNALSVLPEDATDLPPIRKPAKIEIDKEAETGKETKTEPAPNTNVKVQPQKLQTTNRIKSTDYNKWDKYDPDEEILRMDLEEERTKEQAQVKVNEFEAAKAKTQTTEHIKICEQSEEEKRLEGQLKKLSQLEREQFAENFRLRGNEYYKTKEYEQAIKEYTLAIVYDPKNAAKAYNNRAITNLKLYKYVAAIEDCEACLRLEPENVKALLRLADANYGYGRRRESYDLYKRVLQLESNNVPALKMLEQLNQQLGELAPEHATRLIIEEIEEPKKEKKATKKEQPKAIVKPQPKIEKPKKEYDLAELVKPNRVVKSKIVSAAEALGKLKAGNPNANPGQKQQQQQLPLMMPHGMAAAEPELRLPLTATNNNNNTNKSGNNNKLLIQEM